MNAIEKKMKKEMKSRKKSSHSQSLSAESRQDLDHILPTRLHRDMRLICDVFRISERTRYALRSFDAATLDDFSLMTDEDFADMIVMTACNGAPLPPLQQRKVSVLLRWAQALSATATEDAAYDAPANRAEGFELAEKRDGEEGVLKALYKASPRNGNGKFVPADWEAKFYQDLPRLRTELREMGRERPFANWATEFLSLRWIFCG